MLEMWLPSTKERSQSLDPDRKVIGRHWNEKHCYIGEKLPSATEVESQLRAEQIAIHEKILRHPAEAKSSLNQDFPSELCILSKMKCCSKCGFTSNETKDHNKHYGKTNQYGCMHEFHSNLSKEVVITNNTTRARIPQNLRRCFKTSTMASFHFPTRLHPLHRSTLNKWSNQ